jgi:hypothetical protein
MLQYVKQRAALMSVEHKLQQQYWQISIAAAIAAATTAVAVAAAVILMQ